MTKSKSLNFDEEVFETSELSEGHYCKDCEYTLDASVSAVYDTLPDHDFCLDDKTKTNLVYIAGYVVYVLCSDQASWK